MTPPENLSEPAITVNGKQVRSGGQARPGSPATHLAAIHIYPLKSARGIDLDEWPLDDLGLAWDRRWLISTTAGRALTQREEPRLALLRPRLDECLTLTGPGMPPLEVALEADLAAPRLEVLVLDQSLQAAAVSAAADRWVSRYLGYSARLLRQQEPRPVSADYALSDTDRTGFADGFPLLVIGAASLADLNARLARPLPMNRFRPNLVVAGAPAFAEDEWSRIRVGEVELALVKPCARCVITTTDQDTAARGHEPLRTLAQYRRTAAGKVLFGQNGIHRSIGTLRTGDVVSVLARRAAPELVPPGAQIPPALP